MQKDTRESCDQQVGEILKQAGAWQTGHFLLTSGRHSDQYMQCQRAMQYPQVGGYLADLLAEKLVENDLVPATVVGPALGAVHWEVFVAQALERAVKSASATIAGANRRGRLLEKLRSEQGQLIKAVFAEKAGPDQVFEIRRGVRLVPGEQVVVVEDVTTTGGSARRVLNLVRELGCEPLAVGAVVDRSGGAITYDEVPFLKLLSIKMDTWDADDCPLCREGSKPIKPGSSRS